MNRPRSCWINAELVVPGMGAAIKGKAITRANIKVTDVFMEFINYESRTGLSAGQVALGLNSIKYTWSSPVLLLLNVM